MKSPHYLAILLTCLIFVSCKSKDSPKVASPDATDISEDALSPLNVREVNRYEFVESEIVGHPEDEKEFNHFYMGSLDGFDYVSVRANKYKIPSEQLELDHSFPLTKDTTKWIRMRIHFSHVKIE